MPAVRLLLLIALTSASAIVPAQAQQSARAPLCAEWRDCRQQALAAADRGDYEAFHDLAWRAVQTGPPKDPALMVLLARAQSLSGRPHDALVMLQRLADLGVASDAATSDDFRRVRELPGWPEIMERTAGLATIAPPARSDAPTTTRAAAPAPRSAARAAANAPPPAEAAAPKAAPAAPAVVPAPEPAAPAAAAALTPPTEAVRFSSERFAVSGLAYDTVSRRFLLGDRVGRKLVVVGEGANHAVDLVRADSAGFQDISAIEIDGKRGDLWVASIAAADGPGTVHKLQLISGRPLKTFHVAADAGPVALVDLAVSAAGAVLVLDAAGKQLLILRPGAQSLERVLRITAQDATSLALSGDDNVAYVAHRDGVARIDLRARTAAAVSAPKGISLAHLERIRWHHNALVGVQLDDDGTRHIVEFELNAGGKAVAQVETLATPAIAAGPTAVTIAGDELVYLAPGSDAAGPAAAPVAGLAEFVAYRVHLR